MPEPSDDNLISRILTGDRAAFARLVRRHEQPLAALIRRLIPDRHHQEDVLQLTLLQAWQGLVRLRDRSKVKAWLIGIARNRCRDFHRSASRRPEPADNETLEVCINRTGRAVRDPAEAEDVAGAVRRVAPTQRRAAELFYVQGFTIAEISRRLEAPEGTIKSRLFHAREALRRQLEGRRPRKG